MSRVQWIGAPVEPVTFLIGDSLAVGLSAPLTAEFGTNFKFAAKGGTTVLQWLTGAQAGQLAAVLSTSPARVLVSLGTNDTNSKVPADKLKSQVAALVQKIRDVGAEVLWLMPGKLPWQYPELAAAVAATGARVIQQPDVKKSDGIHPTGEGYVVWAKKIHDELVAPAPSVSTGAKASIAPLAVVAAIVGLAWWLT